MPTTPKQKTSYTTIHKQLRREIESDYVPGQMLASENTLASRFSVSRLTIRRALAVLRDEGLVQSYHGRGTVVADRLSTGEMAIVLSDAMLEPNGSRYYSMVTARINESIRNKHPRMRVRTHIEPYTKDPRNFPKELTLMEPDVLRTLRGVFTFNPLYQLEDELKAANVPVVTMGKAGTHRITYDRRQFMELAARHIADAGARTIGIIWTTFLKEIESEEDNFLLIFRDTIGKLGLQTKPQWCVCHEGHIAESDGYDRFLNYWKMPEKPAALIVTDDVLCAGVLRATLKLGLSLPKDIKCLTLSNAGVTLPYHKPVTSVNVSPEEMAKRAVSIMTQLVRGDEASSGTIRTPVTLSIGETT
ncbi:MAG: substrate-binding domain-containing protein [Candidatus Pacebacteria bacterium]|nr:substrate-binding domain-containing protein [Candidatus Paceibacterota bacterium]